jgi:hypothetical protein
MYMSTWNCSQTWTQSQMHEKPNANKVRKRIIFMSLG